MGPRQISSVRIASTGMTGCEYSREVKGEDIGCCFREGSMSQKKAPIQASGGSENVTSL